MAIAPLDDPGNPLDVPPGENSAASLDGQDSEAIRRAHSRDEAYVKAVGRLNYLYASLFTLEAVYFNYFTYLHLTGSIRADWVVRPGWIAIQADCWLTAILALIAGYGFRHLKRWALGVEALFSYGALFFWVLGICSTNRPPRLAEFAAQFALMCAIFAPLINLLDILKSQLMTSEYARVVGATRSIRVRARLPWNLKLTAIFCLFLFIICIIIAARNGQ